MVRGLILQRPVAVAYHSHARRQRGEPPRHLRVHPLNLTIHRNAVYFVVDILDGERRGLSASRILLTLDRLTDAVTLEDVPALEYPEDFDAKAHFAGTFGISTRGRELRQIAIRIDSALAPYVKERRWHDSQQLIDQPNGELLVTLELQSFDEVMEWILGMGEHVEVLEPEELRQKVTTRPRAALANYAVD